MSALISPKPEGEENPIERVEQGSETSEGVPVEGQRGTRRDFLKALGLGGAAVLGVPGCGGEKGFEYKESATETDVMQGKPANFSEKVWRQMSPEDRNRYRGAMTNLKRQEKIDDHGKPRDAEEERIADNGGMVDHAWPLPALEAAKTAMKSVWRGIKLSEAMVYRDPSNRAQQTPLRRVAGFSRPPVAGQRDERYDAIDLTVMDRAALLRLQDETTATRGRIRRMNQTINDKYNYTAWAAEAVMLGNDILQIMDDIGGSGKLFSGRLAGNVIGIGSFIGVKYLQSAFTDEGRAAVESTLADLDETLARIQVSLNNATQAADTTTTQQQQQQQDQLRRQHEQEVTDLRQQLADERNRAVTQQQQQQHQQQIRDLEARLAAAEATTAEATRRANEAEAARQQAVIDKWTN